MTSRIRPVLCLCLVASLGLSACEDKKAPPSASSGGPLGGLAENPTSLPGKSAGMARDAKRAAEGAQNQALDMANQISGGGEGTVLVQSLQFKLPAGWQSVQPPNRMQTAAVRVATDEGQGETAVAFFTGLGGDVASNINRWKGQVKTDDGQPAEAKITESTVNGFKLTIVSMDGTYSAMTMGSSKPMPGFGFRGAIIEDPAGIIFVRLTGPADKVKAADSAFSSMLKGATKQ